MSNNRSDAAPSKMVIVEFFDRSAEDHEKPHGLRIVFTTGMVWDVLYSPAPFEVRGLAPEPSPASNTLSINLSSLRENADGLRHNAAIFRDLNQRSREQQLLNSAADLCDAADKIERLQRLVEFHTNETAQACQQYREVLAENTNLKRAAHESSAEQIHRVCQFLREEVGSHIGVEVKCEKCPLVEQTPYGEGTRMCVERAKELLAAASSSQPPSAMLTPQEEHAIHNVLNFCKLNPSMASTIDVTARTLLKGLLDRAAQVRRPE